jgi:hypothetical protein
MPSWSRPASGSRNWKTTHTGTTATTGSPRASSSAAGGWPGLSGSSTSSTGSSSNYPGSGIQQPRIEMNPSRPVRPAAGLPGSPGGSPGDSDAVRRSKDHAQSRRRTPRRVTWLHADIAESADSRVSRHEEAERSRTGPRGTCHPGPRQPGTRRCAEPPRPTARASATTPTDSTCSSAERCTNYADTIHQEA